MLRAELLDLLQGTLNVPPSSPPAWQNLCDIKVEGKKEIDLVLFVWYMKIWLPFTQIGSLKGKDLYFLSLTRQVKQ